MLKFLLLITMLSLPSQQAGAVTIGGTDDRKADKAKGPMAMFSGDRFDNFRNMGRYVPTSRMSASPTPWRLAKRFKPLEYSGNFLGKPTSLEQFIALSDSSAFIVIKDGRIVYETYTNGDSANSLHMSFSVAKSFTSALTGMAIADGFIEAVSDPVRKYLPELTSKTFDGVTIEHVLQMSSGIRFNETYTDPSSDINQMMSKVPPMSYLEYINTLGQAQKPGTFNHYASINSQLLGILVSRVTGQSITNYMTKKLWHPLGMEHDGLWTLDEQGQELTMGGLAASARDYAKLGLLYLNQGKRGDTQLLSAEWVKASVIPDEPHLMPGKNPGSSNQSGYQYQWWTPKDWDNDYLARGIWGQNIYVHPKNKVVIVKLAADQKNFDPTYKQAYIDYMQDLAQSLTP